MIQRHWAPEVTALGDRIANLNVLSASQLLNYLRDVYGITATACPVPIPIPVTQLIVGPVIRPAPTEFDVVLAGFDPARKINVIKAVREQTGLGLKDALELVTFCPRPIRERLEPERAAQIKAALEAVGGKVEVRPVA
jgi:large subunit ribosomal protein L7/L12